MTPKSIQTIILYRIVFVNVVLYMYIKFLTHF